MVIYRIMMGCVAPILIGLTLAQRLRGRLAAGAMAQRLGFVTHPVDVGAEGSSGGVAGRATIWLHGASNGEVTSALPVLRDLLAARPGLRVLVTANTGTAVQMVDGWDLPGVQAALSPIDAWGAARRVLARWRPALLVVVENELWPARLAAAGAAGVPVALIGARMSLRSARTWARIAPGLVRGALGRLAYVSAQDEGSAARLVALGLDAGRLGPVVMLKAAVTPMALAADRSGLPRDRVLLAASTHPGEEALIVQAFAAARRQFDLLILAPRHPRRSAEVAAVIAAAGLSFTRRSDGAEPDGRAPVFLADTMGEMARWYAMAGVTVIGGSFVPLGGHTPYEPVAAGSAPVHGPHMENFAAPAAALARAGGALSVGRAGLAAALAELDAARQAKIAAAAQQALAVGGPQAPEMGKQNDGIGAVTARLLALLDGQSG